MLETYRKWITLHDANGNVTDIEIEITHRNGYPEFTMCNEHGQGRDDIVPKNDNQKELLELWKTWHLNGKDNPLPEDFIESVLDPLVERLEEDEEEYKENLVTIEMIDKDFFIERADELETTPEKLMAMCLFRELSLSALENVSSNYGNEFNIEGRDYLVCTDDEADEEHLEYIRNLVDELGWEAFSKGSSSMSVEMDKLGDITVSQSITIDGSERGNMLNGWNGEQEEYDVNGETFYFYRR